MTLFAFAFPSTSTFEWILSKNLVNFEFKELNRLNSEKFLSIFKIYIRSESSETQVKTIEMTLAIN